METYRVSCKKKTANKNSSVRKTKQNRLMILSNCGVCGKKKNKLSLKVKKLIIFPMIRINIINKVLLYGDTFIPELH